MTDKAQDLNPTVAHHLYQLPSSVTPVSVSRLSLLPLLPSKLFLQQLQLLSLSVITPLVTTNSGMSSGAFELTPTARAVTKTGVPGQMMKRSILLLSTFLG